MSSLTVPLLTVAIVMLVAYSAVSTAVWATPKRVGVPAAATAIAAAPYVIVYGEGAWSFVDREPCVSQIWYLYAATQELSMPFPTRVSCAPGTTRQLLELLFPDAAFEDRCTDPNAKDMRVSLHFPHERTAPTYAASTSSYRAWMRKRVGEVPSTLVTYGCHLSGAIEISARMDVVEQCRRVLGAERFLCNGPTPLAYLARALLDSLGTYHEENMAAAQAMGIEYVGVRPDGTQVRVTDRGTHPVPLYRAAPLVTALRDLVDKEHNVLSNTPVS